MENHKKKVLLLSVLAEKNAILAEELGICSIAAYLESKGYEVILENSTRNYVDFKKIISESPDLIGFPMYSTTEEVVVNVCRTIKRSLPNVICVLGGYWPTLYPKKLLEKYPEFDYVIMGEGEIVFYNLLKAIEKNKSLESVKGIAYRNDSKIIVNEREDPICNLDDLPFPRRDLLVKNRLKYAYISTSRGCLGNCSFCWHGSFWDPNHKIRWRGRSPENIIEEIEILIDKYHVNRFWFIDDSFEDFSNNPNRIWEIAQLIVDKKINISYETYFRAEVYKKFTDEKMELLKKSGLVGIIFGIESGNDDDLKLYNKIASAEDNLKAVEYFRKHDIAVDIGFINFNPYSTFKKLRQNIDYLEKTYFASVLYYLVERCGITEFSPIYYKAKNDQLLIEEGDGCYSYHYVISDIGKMSDYLYYKFHANENSKEYFYSKKIANVIREEFKLLNYIKRNFGKENEKANQLVTDFERVAWKILKDVNSNNAEWFRELLESVENGWNKEEAEKITEKYLNLAYLKGISDELEKHRLSLYIHLDRIGISASEYINFGVTS